MTKGTIDHVWRGLLVKEVGAGKFVVLLDHVCIGLLVK